MAFREDLVLPDGSRFGEAMAEFQRRDFQALERHRFAYIERPRGASKTTDLAAEAVVELFLGPPGGRLYAAAVDRDQAALLHEAAAGWIRRTPVLAQSVVVERWRLIVPATDTVLVVLAADAPSAWGLSPTWVCVDELAQWPEGTGEELWHALYTATGKRRARLVCITTPGWDKTGLCWRVRELARTSPQWYFSTLTVPAPWVDPAWLAEQQASLPPHVFERLHLGRWTDAGGAFLTSTEVDAIFDSALLPAARRMTDAPHALGLDVGLTRDRTVVAVAHRDPAIGCVVIDTLRTWAGQPGAPVALPDVEAEVARLSRAFGAPVFLDPYQAMLLGQRLRAAGVEVREYPFTGESRRRLFATLLQLIRDGRLRSFPHEDLRKELLSLEVTETAAGWRVDHRPGRFDDHVVAVALAAQHLASVAVPVDAPLVVGPTRARVVAQWERRTQREAQRIVVRSPLDPPWWRE
jgi:hypothetical protein